MLTPSPARLQALAEMVDSIRTRQCNEMRTSVLLKAVLGAEAADEAELTGDLGKWEEHCASVKHAPCNRAWHSLATPRVAQPATAHVAQPATAHVAQPAPVRGRWRTPFCAWGSTCRGTWTSCPASRPSSTACSVSTSTRRRHSMYHSALGRSVHGRNAQGHRRCTHSQDEIRCQGCNPVHPRLQPCAPRLQSHARRFAPCTQAATPCTQAAAPCTQTATPCTPTATPCTQAAAPCTQAAALMHAGALLRALHEHLRRADKVPSYHPHGYLVIPPPEHLRRADKVLRLPIPRAHRSPRTEHA